MKTDTRQELYDYIKNYGGTTVKELSQYFGISRQAIHRHLRVLIHQRRLVKVGKAPIVMYTLTMFSKTCLQWRSAPPG